LCSPTYIEAVIHLDAGGGLGRLDIDRCCRRPDRRWRTAGDNAAGAQDDGGDDRHFHQDVYGPVWLFLRLPSSRLMVVGRGIRWWLPSKLSSFERVDLAAHIKKSTWFVSLCSFPAVLKQQNRGAQRDRADDCERDHDLDRQHCAQEQEDCENGTTENRNQQ
jgi:hypothetical protein